jgi:hypothetical protein
VLKLEKNTMNKKGQTPCIGQGEQHSNWKKQKNIKNYQDPQNLINPSM